MSIRTARQSLSATAFSLIEVVLALGVISFGLIAILGVFPTGLSANRTSISDTRAAEAIHSITATIDAQCATFSSVRCYGETWDLTAANPGLKKLYVSYPSPDQPTISNDAALPNWIYVVELTFDNDPAVTPSGTKLGAGKLNKIQLRVRGKSTAEGFVEGFYVARNRG